MKFKTTGASGTPAACEHSQRIADFSTAIRLEVLTIGWMIIEAAVAIFAGLTAGSLLLLAFGIDSIIELISAAVVFRRLRRESSGALVAEASQNAERNAARIAGYLLYLLAAYVILQAAFGLWHRHAAEKSLWGIGVAIIAAAGMPILARAKLRAAAQIGSNALRADGMETLTCGYLAWVLLAGLLANAIAHWWWLDSIASIAIVPLLIREANEAISGECCCANSDE